MKKLRTFITMLIAVLVAAVIVPTSGTKAQTSASGQLMFILDASSSMLDKDGTSTTRIEKAKSALNSAVDTVPSNVAAGLRVYGHRVPDTDKAGSCQDTEALVKPTTGSASSIKSAVAGVQAKGYTPIGKSLQDVKNDFSGEGAKTVILISDGVDTCSPPDPCQVAKDLAASGLKIKINTLGLVVDNAARQQLSCIAQSTGGEYFDVNNVDKLNTTLSAITAREANLFSTKGVPIDGKPRIEDAPLLLPNTSYTDDIVAGEQLFYAFELLPEQKFKIVVTGDNTAKKFGMYDQLVTDWYRVSDSEQMNSGRSPKQFDNLDQAGPVPVQLEGTAPGSQSKTETYAVKVWLDASKDRSGTMPIEIKLTTEGGKAPDNKSASGTKNNDGKEDGRNLLVTAVGALAVLAVLAAAGYGAYKYGVKRAAKSAGTAGGGTAAGAGVANSVPPNSTPIEPVTPPQDPPASQGPQSPDDTNKPENS